MTEILKQILQQIKKDLLENETEVRVGRVSKEASETLKKVVDDHAASHLAIKDKIEAYIEKLESEHDCTPFNERKMDAWEKIYDELELSQADRAKHYKIDHEARIIYLIEKETDEDAVEVGIVIQ